MRNLQYSWDGFNTTFDNEELVPYFDKFFDVILNVYETKSKEFANSFYDNILPVHADQEKLIQRLDALQEGLDEKYVFLTRNIKESIDDIKRKQRAYACFLARAPLALA